MDTYSTANVPRSTSANYWNEVYSSKFAQVTFNPLNRDGFAAGTEGGKHRGTGHRAVPLGSNRH